MSTYSRKYREINTDVVGFKAVGGLPDHIKSIKEKVLFPLLYREVFDKFHTKPPRGILFHGLPGTGKTFTMKALYRECKKREYQISFFFRNGADCLNKYVGESEKTLRHLFERAQDESPSIIFFDEFDALATTRSADFDPVHSSVICTLLALMDGLNSEDKVIVIGSTNKLDVIDPAFRRPGRFDSELYFPLPALEARKDILNIQVSHMKEEKPSPEFIEELASSTEGFTGADLQALCSNALMYAFKRQYPEVYVSESKIKVNVKTIKVEKADFLRAKSDIVPSVQHGSYSPVKKMPLDICPLLQRSLQGVLAQINTYWPYKFLCPDNKENKLNDVLRSPQLILTGSPLQGQSTYLAPAILHRLEHLPVQILDITDFYESPGFIHKKMHVVYQNLPAILYVPEINKCWDEVDDATRNVFVKEIENFKARTPVFLLATSTEPYKRLSLELKQLFNIFEGKVFEMGNPTRDERYGYFRPLFIMKAVIPPKPQQSAATNTERGPEYPKTRNTKSKKMQGEKPSKTSICATPAQTLPERKRPAPATSFMEGGSTGSDPKKIKTELKEEFENLRIKSDGLTCEILHIHPEDIDIAVSIYNVNEDNLEEKEAGTVLIDRDVLAGLLIQILDVTEDCPVDTLEVLYSKLSACITKYQDTFERTGLLNEMYEVIQNFNKERAQDPNVAGNIEHQLPTVDGNIEHQLPNVDGNIEHQPPNADDNTEHQL